MLSGGGMREGKTSPCWASRWSSTRCASSTSGRTPVRMSSTRASTTSSSFSTPSTVVVSAIAIALLSDQPEGLQPGRARGRAVVARVLLVERGEQLRGLVRRQVPAGQLLDHRLRELQRLLGIAARLLLRDGEVCRGVLLQVLDRGRLLLAGCLVRLRLLGLVAREP